MGSTQVSIPYIDDMVKEYLLYRGFTQTLRMFDNERKNDKLKGYQQDKIIELIFSYINNYDIASLMDLWQFLDATFFSKLDRDHGQTVKKLELSLKRYYLVYAVNSGRQDKVKEFFDLCAAELAKDPEWRAWFALPFLKNQAIQDPTFEVFFSKMWVETFSLSLHNFFVTIFNSIPPPKLLNFDQERQVRNKLELNVELLIREKNKLMKYIETIEERSKEEPDQESLVAGVSPAQAPLKELAETSTEIISKFKRPMKSLPTTSDAQTREDQTEKVVIGSRRPPSQASTDAIVDESPVFDHPPFILESQETLLSHASPITQVRFSALGSRVASGSVDGVVRIWGTDALGQNATIFCFSEVLALEWENKSNKLLLCGTADGKIKLWNVFTDKAVGDIATDSDYPRVDDLACNPSGTHFVSATSSTRRDVGQLLSWNLKTLKVESKLSLDSPVPINTLAFNHNGSLLLAGGIDGFIRIYDMNTLQPFTKWKAHNDQVLAAQFSVDETAIFSTGRDGRIFQWSIHTVGQPRAVREYQFEGHSLDPVRHNTQIAFDGEGHYFLVGSRSNHAVMYHVNQVQPLQFLGGHSAPVVAVDWHPVNYSCLTGSLDHSIKLSRLAHAK